jgi:hypothetical protein
MKIEYNDNVSDIRITLKHQRRSILSDPPWTVQIKKHEFYSHFLFLLFCNESPYFEIYHRNNADTILRACQDIRPAEIFVSYLQILSTCFIRPAKFFVSHLQIHTLCCLSFGGPSVETFMPHMSSLSRVCMYSRKALAVSSHKIRPLKLIIFHTRSIKVHI